MKKENAMCNLWYFNYIPEFTDNLTDKTYYSKSIYHLNSMTANVIYGIECSLIYVGEIEQLLCTRMNGHWYDRNNPNYKVIAIHFRLPDHSIVSMKVCIIEQIYPILIA
jgi:hypothetical protein